MFPARRPEHEEAPEAVEKSSTVLKAPTAGPQIPIVHEKPTTVTPVIRMEHNEGTEPQPASAQPPLERTLVVRTRHAIEPLTREEKKERSESEDRALKHVRHATQVPRTDTGEEGDSLPLSRKRNKLTVRQSDSDTGEPETPSPAPQRRRAEPLKETLRLREQRALGSPAAPPNSIRPLASINVPPLNPLQAVRQPPMVPRAEPAEDTSASVQVVIGRVIVQAIVPPSAPAPQAPRAQAPRLSLEEYLRQREGRA